MQKLIKFKLIEIFKLYKSKVLLSALFLLLVMILGMQRNIISSHLDNFIKNLGFSLENITITGISKLNEYEISKHIKYNSCENLFCIDLMATKNSLEKLDWVKAAKKMRKPSWVFDSRSITNSKEVLKAGLKYWLIGDGTNSP